MDSSDLLSRSEFAKRYGELTLGRTISQPTLRLWVREGRVPAPVMIGRSPRFSWSAAMRVLDRQLQRAEQHAA